MDSVPSNSSELNPDYNEINTELSKSRIPFGGSEHGYTELVLYALHRDQTLIVQVDRQQLRRNNYRHSEC